MDEDNKLSWTALEFPERRRSPDWFWALAIIVLASALAAIIYGNYFFAILIVLSGALLWFYALKSPDMISYELGPRGLRVQNRLYPYENIAAFWVQKSEVKERANPILATHEILEPVLFIKSERIFMPIISIPIEDNLAADIRDIMLARNVLEEEMREHPADKIMEWLGF